MVRFKKKKLVQPEEVINRACFFVFSEIVGKRLLEGGEGPSARGPPLRRHAQSERHLPQLDQRGARAGNNYILSSTNHAGIPSFLFRLSNALICSAIAATGGCSRRRCRNNKVSAAGAIVENQIIVRNPESYRLFPFLPTLNKRNIGGARGRRDPDSRSFPYRCEMGLQSVLLADRPTNLEIRLLDLGFYTSEKATSSAR